MIQPQGEYNQAVEKTPVPESERSPTGIPLMSLISIVQCSEASVT